MKTLPTFYFLFLCLFLFIGCSQQPVKTLQNKPLPAWQSELIETAFETASAMPIKPHIKDRSKAQAAVAEACFELDQPLRALEYIDQIKNWRRGRGYADYAFYSMRSGVTNDVMHYLDLADQIARIADQDWRRDRINVRISQTLLLMGREDRARQFSRHIEASESGKVERVEAMLCEIPGFDDQLADLDAMIATEQYDLMVNAMKAAAQLYKQFYSDEERRGRVETLLRDSWDSLPAVTRIELMEGLAETALDKNDAAGALRWVHEARDLMDAHEWPAEYHVPMIAGLAELRFRCGETDAARNDLTAARDLFDKKEAEIVNIYKADALIPVAEAAAVMGDADQARTVYALALTRAVENPNSRPRAEDLTAACLSMALHDVEPSDALRAQVQDVRSHLGDPW